MLRRYSSSLDGKPQKKALLYTAEEHRIKKENVDADAVRIIKKLVLSGYKAYIVGGAVRDLLTGRKPKDFDIVTDAFPSKIKNCFRSARVIGRRFRLVLVSSGAKIYEVATFRALADGGIGNTFGTMDEDVWRRDFTLNSLYYDPIKEIIIDYVGGVKDIQAGKIKPVIPLKRIFTEDPVRMLRAVKYAAAFDFSMSFAVSRKIRSQSALLGGVSQSRLTEEIIKILNGGKSAAIIKKLCDYDLFMHLQPAAASLCDDSDEFRKSYFDSLGELDALASADPNIRLGRKLVYLIQSFVDIYLDESESSGSELYVKTYHECRRFIVPMNPPRAELDYAVRFVLKKNGVSVRFTRSAYRRRKPRARGAVKAGAPLSRSCAGESKNPAESARDTPLPSQRLGGFNGGANN